VILACFASLACLLSCPDRVLAVIVAAKALAQSTALKITLKAILFFMIISFM
jgi:hypothetical protein